MRPDETCRRGFDPIPDTEAEDWCSQHYMKGQNHACHVYDLLKSLRKKGKAPKGLLDKVTKEQTKIFYYRCLSLQATSPVFGEVSPCLKCGACCRADYSISKFRDSNKVDPKTGLLDPKVKGRSQGVCQYLEYHPEFDNGIDDFGFRCAIYGTEDMPDPCRNYPDGKTDDFFEAWWESLTSRYRNPRFQDNPDYPDCPFEVEEVL